MVSGYDKQPPEPPYRPAASSGAQTAFLVGVALVLAAFLIWVAV